MNMAKRSSEVSNDGASKKVKTNELLTFEAMTPLNYKRISEKITTPFDNILKNTFPFIRRITVNDQIKTHELFKFILVDRDVNFSSGMPGKDVIVSKEPQLIYYSSFMYHHSKELFPSMLDKTYTIPYIVITSIINLEEYTSLHTNDCTVVFTSKEVEEEYNIVIRSYYMFITMIMQSQFEYMKNVPWFRDFCVYLLIFLKIKNEKKGIVNDSCYNGYLKYCINNRMIIHSKDKDGKDIIKYELNIKPIDMKKIYESKMHASKISAVDPNAESSKKINEQGSQNTTQVANDQNPQHKLSKNAIEDADSFIASILK